MNVGGEREGDSKENNAKEKQKLSAYNVSRLGIEPRSPQPQCGILTTELSRPLLELLTYVYILIYFNYIFTMHLFRFIYYTLSSPCKFIQEATLSITIHQLNYVRATDCLYYKLNRSNSFDQIKSSFYDYHDLLHFRTNLHLLNCLCIGHEHPNATFYLRFIL